MMERKISSQKDKNGSTIIAIRGNIYSSDIYGTFMTEVNRYMKGNMYQKAKIPPVISLERLNWVDSAVPPLLLSICRILRDYYGKKIPFVPPLKDSVRQYLYLARFYSIALGLDTEDGQTGNELLDLDYNDISGFETNGRFYNRENRIARFEGINQYYDLKTDEHKRTLKYILQDRYRKFTIGHIFDVALIEKLGRGTQEYETCIMALSELICNAVLYSLSDSYVSVQMVSRRDYRFSVCDTGVGFRRSLKLKGADPDEAKRYAVGSNIVSNSLMDDFFAIFSALKHAEETNRTNLWKLIHIVNENGGTIKIHNNRTQLIFGRKGSPLYIGPYKDAYETMNKVLNRYSSDYTRTPLRIHRARLQGVHIEIIFKGEN